MARAVPNLPLVRQCLVTAPSADSQMDRCRACSWSPSVGHAGKAQAVVQRFEPRELGSGMHPLPYVRGRLDTRHQRLEVAQDVPRAIQMTEACLRCRPASVPRGRLSDWPNVRDSSAISRSAPSAWKARTPRPRSKWRPLSSRIPTNRSTGEHIIDRSRRVARFAELQQVLRFHAHGVDVVWFAREDGFGEE